MAGWNTVIQSKMNIEPTSNEEKQLAFQTLWLAIKIKKHH